MRIIWPLPEAGAGDTGSRYKVTIFDNDGWVVKRVPDGFYMGHECDGPTPLWHARWPKEVTRKYISTIWWWYLGNKNNLLRCFGCEKFCEDKVAIILFKYIYDQRCSEGENNGLVRIAWK